MEKTILHAVCLVAALCSSSILAYAQEGDEQPFSSAPFGARDLLCTSDSGTEIKEERVIRAPPGYFFLDVTAIEAAPTKSYAGGDIGCIETGRETADMIATVNGRRMTVKVPVAIKVFAHADCGSGLGPVLSRWTITGYCKAEGRIAPLGH